MTDLDQSREQPPKGSREQAESKLRADNKALCEARAKRRELKAKAKLQLPNMEEPHSHSPSPAAPVTETEIANFTYLAAHGSITPLSYKEAIRSPESVEWNKAMRAEIVTISFLMLTITGQTPLFLT